MALRGKRKIANLQISVDFARMTVNSVNNELLIIEQEGPASISPEECSRMLHSLIMAEEAIREAKSALEAGV